MSWCVLCAAKLRDGSEVVVRTRVVPLVPRKAALPLLSRLWWRMASACVYIENTARMLLNSRVDGAIVWTRDGNLPADAWDDDGSGLLDTTIRSRLEK